MSVTLEIPDNFSEQLQKHPAAAQAQLHLEAAIALYRQGELPLGNAATFSGMSQNEFEKTLRERQIPMPYSMKDLEHDVAYARGRR